MSLFSDIQKSLAGGFGQSIISKVPQANQFLSQGEGILQDIQDGNLIGVGQRILNGGRRNGGNNHFNTKTAMLGGLSPQEALTIYNKQHGIEWCRKNLWFIEVSSKLKGENNLFNMLCYSADFSPFTVTGEKKQIGAGHIDIVNSSDPVELNLVTYDNKKGEIKRWFEDHAVACAASDGTVGLPSDYAIKIKFTHAFINRETNQGGYESSGLFRTGNISLALARTEQALSEITMSFVQLDTFMGIG